MGEKLWVLDGGGQNPFSGLTYIGAHVGAES